MSDDPVDVNQRTAALADSFAAGTRFTYVARAEGKILGCVGLSPSADGTFMSLSYWLCAEATGRGFATEAAWELCALAFQYVERVEITCHANNGASSRVARRLGFVRGGRAMESGSEVDVWSGERARVAAWRSVAATCAEVAAFGISDSGTIIFDGIELAIVPFDGNPHVVVTSTIGADTVFGDQACLIHNATLAVGALCIVDGWLQLRYACPVGGITREALCAVVHEAARLRRLVERVAPDLLAGGSPLSAYFTD
jgi:L-amino acid N-acyltransferase YncA